LPVRKNYAKFHVPPMVPPTGNTLAANHANYSDAEEVQVIRKCSLVLDKKYY